jgi:hypothetical protein
MFEMIEKKLLKEKRRLRKSKKGVGFQKRKKDTIFDQINQDIEKEYKCIDFQYEIDGNLNEQKDLVYQPAKLLNENLELSLEDCELNKFLTAFANFQSMNNIGFLSAKMESKNWIQVNNFIFSYIQDLVKQQNVHKIVENYGYYNGLRCLIRFYKNELKIDNLRTEDEILNHIFNQGELVNMTETTLAIFREIIDFPMYNHKTMI